MNELSPNEDKEAKLFFETVFNDNDYRNFNHIVYTGDYNVPLNHDVDTAGYLHENNHTAHKYMKGRMVTNELIDIWHLKIKGVRAFTFDKKQTTNRTKARLDYFLISQTTQRYITDAHIGRASILSDHRPIFITISPSQSSLAEFSGSLTVPY